MTTIESPFYWKTRCLLAEKYIEESPCDPDIYDEQIKAYNKWQDFKNKTPTNVDVDYMVFLLKITLDNKNVKVVFENKEDEIDYILDICNSFKETLKSF
jgi:hypothetical protein